MSSITWQVGVPELMGYASAKAAVVGFTHSLARQVGKHRIRVNAIAPGFGADGESSKGCGIRQSRKVAAVVKNQFPARHHHAGRPSPGWRCSSPPTTGRMITKQTFNVNGGARMIPIDRRQSSAHA